MPTNVYMQYKIYTRALRNRRERLNVLIDPVAYLQYYSLRVRKGF